jgi:cyclopropane fatty-acyl-phospholipid synthase-like methyltransferase
MPYRNGPPVSKSLPGDYFDQIYAAEADPWNFTTSEYEAGKYKHTLEALPCARYGSAFEIGCSIGVLTSQLAARCDRLLSVDVAETALQAARKRCAHWPQVRFERMAVPGEYPAECFDLTVVSEVGYYLSRPDLEQLAGRIQQHTTAHGQLLLVHWLPPVADYPLTGDEVHEYFLSLPNWECLTSFRAPQYRLELLQRKDGDA